MRLLYTPVVVIAAAIAASLATAEWFQEYRPPVQNFYSVTDIKKAPAGATIKESRTQISTIEIADDGDPILLFSDGTACLRPVISGWLRIADRVTVSGSLGEKTGHLQWIDDCRVKDGDED